MTPKPKRTLIADLLYVDNSKVWTEGMRVSAVQNGIAPDIVTAMNHNILDYGWKLDFGRLFGFAGGQKADVKRAVLYGFRPPRNDSLWAAANRKGFDVVVHDRNVQNNEKKIDVHIATDIVADSYELLDINEVEITLVAGDKDYVPTIDRLRERNINFEIVFGTHAAYELRQACTRYTPIDQFLEYLQLK